MTIDKVDLSKVNESSELMDLVNNLNTLTNYSERSIPQSIMFHGNHCKCDDGYLCEHRLQFIINKLVNHSINEGK